MTKTFLKFLIFLNKRLIVFKVPRKKFFFDFRSGVQSKVQMRQWSFFGAVQFHQQKQAQLH